LETIQGFSGSYVLHLKQGLHESKERIITVHLRGTSYLTSNEEPMLNICKKFFILTLFIHEYYNTAKAKKKKILRKCQKMPHDFKVSDFDQFQKFSKNPCLVILSENCW